MEKELRKDTNICHSESLDIRFGLISDLLRKFTTMSRLQFYRCFHYSVYLRGSGRLVMEPVAGCAPQGWVHSH